MGKAKRKYVVFPNPHLTLVYTHEDPRGVRSKRIPKINQAEISRLSGLGRGHISRILSGKVIPGVSTLVKIGKVLGLGLEATVQWLSTVQKQV